MSELGGDFARTPKDLLATEGDNPTGNDFVTTFARQGDAGNDGGRRG